MFPKFFLNRKRNLEGWKRNCQGEGAPLLGIDRPLGHTRIKLDSLLCSKTPPSFFLFNFPSLKVHILMEFILNLVINSLCRTLLRCYKDVMVVFAGRQVNSSTYALARVVLSYFFQSTFDIIHNCIIIIVMNKIA
jgi:hypothetical protein